MMCLSLSLCLSLKGVTHVTAGAAGCPCVHAGGAGMVTQVAAAPRAVPPRGAGLHAAPLVEEAVETP